jgi:3-keto-L-gulonate-6-phosphate decarboxylase
MGVRIQLALDTADSATAIAAATACGEYVDVIEAGTVLCLAEGLGAVRRLREAFPNYPLVADIRIARAGAKFAAMAFAAGADRVTVVGEAGMAVIEGALAAAWDFGGEVEVELAPRWSEDEVLQWAAAGVTHVIAHRFIGGPLREDQQVATTLERLSRLDLGAAHVTLAGGIRAGELDELADLPFDTVALGSSIVSTPDPGAAAAAFRAELANRAAMQSTA